MQTKIKSVLIIIVTLALCLSITSPAVEASDEEEVLQVATNWAKAFNASDFELMSSLFWNSPEATRFGPAKGGAFLMQGGESIIKIWESTLESTKGAIAVSIHNPNVTMVGSNVAVLNAYATATYTDPKTKEQSISQVRGTFVVQKIGGKWLIVHEHSSIFPTE